MTKRRKKSRIQISEDDYYKAKGITREEAEASDYVPCIFKPRLALIPLVLATGIYLWYFCTLPPLEFGWKFFYGIMLVCVLLMMAGLEKAKHQFIQWVIGIVTLIFFYLLPYVGSLLLWFLPLIAIIWPWGFGAAQWKRGRKKTAIALGVSVFIAGAAAFYLLGLNLVDRAYSALSLPHTASRIEKIEFRQNEKTPIFISSQPEIRRIMTSWQMYVWSVKKGRASRPYDVEAHQPWGCKIYYRDGQVKTFTISLGLRYTPNSLCIIDTTPTRIPNLFSNGNAYQSPELYKVLFPLLWGTNRKER